MKKFLLKTSAIPILIISFFTLAAGLGYMRYVEYRDIKKTSKTLDKLTGRFEARQYLFARLVESFVEGRSDLATVIYHPNSDEATEAGKKMKLDAKKIKQILIEYKSGISDDTEQELYDSLLTVYRTIVSDADHALILFSQGKKAEAREFDARQIQPLYSKLQQINFRLSDYVKERDFQYGDALINGFTKVIESGKNMTYVMAALLILLGFFIFNAVQLIMRKKNELVDSEKQYRDFIEQTHELIARTDVQGRVIFANKKLKELLGYTDEELSELTVYDIVVSDFLDNLKEDFKNQEKLKSKTHVTGALIAKNKQRIDIEGNVIWEYKNGRFYGATSFINDVTERNRLHNIMEESERRFRKLFDLAPIPMFTVVPATMKFLLVNKAALRFYGYTEEEFLSKNLMEIRPKKDIPRTASAIAMIVEENWNYNGIHKHIKKDGSMADVEIFATRIEIGEKPSVMTTVIDITERRQSENKVTQAIIKTQEQERYEIGSELHDNVCQILAAAKMSMSMLKPALPTRSEKTYNLIIESIMQATNEIRNISHRLAPVFFKDGSLKDSIERLIATFNLENKYEVSFYYDEAVEENALSIELQLNLYRILQEQLRNIVKYSQASKIKLDIAIQNENLHMFISDNGVGFELDKTTDGIGFSNMKRRVEFFSGKMSVFSSPGNGCEVLVKVPIKTMEAESVQYKE